MGRVRAWPGFGPGRAPFPKTRHFNMKLLMQFRKKLCLVAGLMPLVAVALTEETVGEYQSVAAGRAAKIVASLALEDEAVAASLKQAIADQYTALFVLHELRDEALAALRSYDPENETFEEKAAEGLEEATRQAVRARHRVFIAQLAALVDAGTVDAVKDGMTYNVAPNTYQVYMDMLPDLPEEHRVKVKAWLLEAREYAMDAGSSDEKHRWFGKYKGRINNYLSSHGYDLKAAERAMWDRRKKEEQ